MTDKLRRQDDTGEVWDDGLFAATSKCIRGLGMEYEPAGAGLDVGSGILRQLQEEFRADQ